MKKYTGLLIIVILWIISIYSIIVAYSNSYEIGIHNLIGYGLLILITILWFYKIRKFKTILFYFLIIGSINAIQFTHFSYTIVFTWSPLGQNFTSFGFQPLSLLLLTFFILSNYSEFRNKLTETFSEDPNEKIERQKRLFLKYYEELKSEKDTKLQEIVDNKKMFQPEYFNAARKLFEERQREKIE